MAVAAGSIAFVAVSNDTAAQGFAFVVLEPVAAGDSMRFVVGDKTGAALSPYAQFVWTNGGTTLAAGTVVQLSIGFPNGVPTTTVAGGGSATTEIDAGYVPATAGIFAVTGTTASPGTYVAAIYAGVGVGTLSVGTSVVDLGTASTALDVGSINLATAAASYADAAAARAAYTSAANWIRDGGVNDGTGTNNAEWPPLSDPNAPLYAKTTLAVDTTAPTVVGVAYGANDGALAAGEAATLTVAFSESVTVAGTPTLTLNSGGTDAYTSGSGSSALTFAYTPAAGQAASDLAVTAFNLNGGTVQDGARNSAVTAAAVADPAGTLAVDTAAPTVAGVAYGTNDGALAAGEAVALTVTFSEAVAVTGAPTLTLNSGGAATYTGGSGTATLAFSYTPAAGQTVSDLAATGFNLNGGTVKDAAGNSANTAGASTNPPSTLSVDTAAPSASGVGYGSNDGAVAAGETMTLTVQFTDAVAVTGAPTLTLNSGGTAAYASGSGSNKLTFSYTAAAGQGTADLAVTGLVLNGGTVKDAAGNNAVTTGAAGNPGGTVAVDTAAPNAPAIAEATDDAGAVQGLLASGAATDDTSPTLVGTAEPNATIGIYSGGTLVFTRLTNGSGNWSFALPVAVVDGTYTVTARATDAAGNQSADSAPFTLTVDTAAPAAPTIASVVDNAGAVQGPLAAGAATDDATLALSGTAAAGATVKVFNGAALVASATADGSGHWTATTSALADGAVSLSVTATDAAGNVSAASAAFAATVDTTPDADVSVHLVDATAGAGGASVSLDLSGLDAGSTAEVTFTGADGGSTTHSYTADGAATADVSGLLGDVSASVHVVDAAGNAAAGQGGTLAADPVCFYPGTLVATPAGEVPVETLAAGDLVLTADGRSAPVRWLGRQTVSTRFADPLRVLPVRIMAGALGEHLPRRDLLVSADHALLLDGVLVQAGALANGSTIRREAGVPEVFTYWHVELADHALVLAEGVPAESFIDNVARLAFDNWAEHEAAAAPAPIAEMELPRAKAHRQVPSATRARLAERAAVLAGAAAA